MQYYVVRGILCRQLGAEHSETRGLPLNTWCMMLRHIRAPNTSRVLSSKPAKDTRVILICKMSSSPRSPPERRRFKAVVFDVDGTLIDSNDAHARAFQNAFSENGKDFPFEDVRRMIGMGGDNLIPTLSGIASDSPDGEHISQLKKNYFSEEVDSIKPQDGAKELVELLKRQGFKIGLASSCKSEELDAFLKIIGIDKNVLDGYTTSDDIDTSKPAPDAVKASLEKLGVSPSEAIMIGDTPFDLDSATKASVATIIFRCGGFWSDKDFPRALAIYDSPRDMIDHLVDSPMTWKEDFEA